MIDVFSLELAIYFILPPVLLFALSYLCAGIFVPIAQLVAECEVSHDSVMTAIAVLIIATTVLAMLAY
ncbi:MAG: hypothetical protein AAF664_09320 [Planctomycetota bacterium]